MFKIEEEKNSIKYLSYLEKLSKMFAHDKIPKLSFKYIERHNMMMRDESWNISLACIHVNQSISGSVAVVKFFLSLFFRQSQQPAELHSRFRHR